MENSPSTTRGTASPPCVRHQGDRSEVSEHPKEQPGEERQEYVATEPPNTERWSACSKTMKQHDEDLIRGWKEDIDTLLVFAGLFSAVLTAFTIESYQQLQNDPAQTTTELLRYIAIELSNRTTSFSTFDLHDIIGDSFEPSPASVRVNTLWFSALVCSLVVALIGILAKQWLREYLSEVSSSPRETVRLRQYRHDGLLQWHVVTIMATLPVLLELALVLFLLGMLDFLWQLNAAVAGVTTSLVVVSLLFYSATTILPAFSACSPFKSPQAWAFCRLIWNLRRFHRFIRPRAPIDVLLNTDVYLKTPDSWREREIDCVRVEADRLDYRALEWTYKCSLDEDLLDLIIPCVNDLKPHEAASLAFEVIARKGETTVPSIINVVHDSPPRLGLRKFMSRAGERGKSRVIHMLLDLLPRMDRNTERSNITSIDILHVLRNLLTDSELAFCELAIHRRALDTLALLMDERGSFHIQQFALNLLSEMTNMACNMSYCPEGIQNVAICAKSAQARNDDETFVRCCGVLLARLPALQPRIQDPQWKGQPLIQSVLSDIARYFHIRNERGLPYDIAKWCSMLTAFVTLERELVADLVVALQSGVRLGLVHCDLEEGDALSRLADTYLVA